METPEFFSQPMLIVVPPEVEKFMAEVCKGHLSVIDKKFSDELVSNDKTQESFWVSGEFFEADGKVYCQLKGHKKAVTQP